MLTPGSVTQESFLVMLRYMQGKFPTHYTITWSPENNQNSKNVSKTHFISTELITNQEENNYCF